MKTIRRYSEKRERLIFVNNYGALEEHVCCGVSWPYEAIDFERKTYLGVWKINWKDERA